MILHFHFHQSLQYHCVVEFLQAHSFRGLLERVEQVDQLLVVDLQDGAGDLVRL